MKLIKFSKFTKYISLVLVILMSIIVSIKVVNACNSIKLQADSKHNNVQHFVYLGGDSEFLTLHQEKLKKSNIQGVQLIYNWKRLETKKGVYDFSVIKQDLQNASKLNKKLFIQIQDRFFMPNAKYIPAYLLQDPEYKGGLAPQVDNPGENMPTVSGFVAKQWVISVRLRYQELLKHLAAEFDGKIYGINLPETAIDIDEKQEKQLSGFSCDNYFNAVLENMQFAKSVFKKSYIVQYINFLPCEWDNDHNYMQRIFDLAIKQNIGLGSPDNVPNKPSFMHNSYKFFNKYHNSLVLVAIAVQEPDLTYINPITKKHFTYNEFEKFATDYLGSNIIFWNSNFL